MDVSQCFSSRRQSMGRREHLGLASATLTRARHLLRDGVPDAGYVAAVRAVLLSVPSAVADRRTSAVLWSMDLLVEPEGVEIRVPHGTSVSMTGVDRRKSRDRRSVALEVRGWEALTALTAVDTVLECALSRPMREAVVIGDSALRNGTVTMDDLVAGVDARAQHPGSTRLRRLLTLLDPASGSVLESVLRYLLVQAGLDPISQYVVRIGKELIGRFDFCLEQARLIIECDGRRWHDPDDIREKDRVRGNGLARGNWRLLRFTWSEIVYNGAFVVWCVRESLAMAA